MNKTTRKVLTNRDLYQTLHSPPGPAMSLTDYLSRLADRLTAYCGQTGLSAADFVAALCDGGPGQEPEEPQGEPNPAFVTLQTGLRTQIEDLRWLQAEELLNSPHRYFGLDVPAGRRWYNFEVADYLEAAVVGTFGGWQPGDGGRQLVPGEVAVLDAQGGLTSVPAADVPNPVEAIEFVDWVTMADFIDNGRSYE